MNVSGCAEQGGVYLARNSQNRAAARCLSHDGGLWPSPRERRAPSLTDTGAEAKQVGSKQKNSSAVEAGFCKNGAGGGSRTHTALRPTDFLTSAAFAALCGPGAFHKGLGSGLSLHRAPNMGVRCCPSSLYTFPKHRFGLGSGLPFQVSPNLSSSASPVSRRALKFCLSPPRLPFRHARTAIKNSTIERRFRRLCRQGKTHL